MRFYRKISIVNVVVIAAFVLLILRNRGKPKEPSHGGGTVLEYREDKECLFVSCDSSHIDAEPDAGEVRPTDGSPVPPRNQTATIKKCSLDSRSEDAISVRLDLARPAFNGDCSGRNVRFAQPDSLPLCALVSYPGSGNTWLRGLIQSSTGIFTGSIYKDPVIYAAGYYGEMEAWNSGTTIVQKCHEWTKELAEAFDGRAILLIRNPYSSILSYYNFIYAGHQEHAPTYLFKRTEWKKFVKVETRNWLKLARNWLISGRRLWVLYYEDLVSEPEIQLENIMKFLGLPTQLTPSLHACLKENQMGKWRRKKNNLPNNVELFPKSSRERLDRAINYVAYLTEKFGCVAPPLHRYEFYNSTLSSLQAS